MGSSFLLGVAPWISQWATPIWLVSAGVTLGAVILGVIGLIVGAVSRRLGRELQLALYEGVLWPLAIIVMVLAGFTVAGLFVIEDPRMLAESLQRLSSAGDRPYHFDIAPARKNPKDLLETPKYQEITLGVPRVEMRRIVFESSENLDVLTGEPGTVPSRGARFEVAAGGPMTLVPVPDTLMVVFPDAMIDKLYVLNHGDKPASLDMRVLVLPPAPEVRAIPFTAICFVLLIGLYLVQRSVAPKASAVALATFKSETAQPFFLIVTIIGVVALAMFEFIPYNTFGEDVKMLEDSGLHLIKVLAILQAIWAASTSIAEEVEGKTALTVLSKPIGRRSFIVGKFLGIFWTLVLLYTILSLVFMVVVAYKPIFDTKEGASFEISWQVCHQEMMRVVPGIALSFMETIMLAAVSVAISTRLPLLANFVISFAFYVLGNLVPLIVQSGAGRFEIVKFFGQLIGVLFPNLESFSIEAAIAGGKDVPLAYLGGAGIYCVTYTLVAMLLALILFEDRDLA